MALALSSRRRSGRLSMTSLIDIIFLLLLFFMLTSTFSRFAEVELSAAGGGAGQGTPPQTQVLFLRLSESGPSLNGTPVPTGALHDTVATRSAEADTPMRLLIAVTGGVTAQELTDTLVALRGINTITLTVLEAG